MSFPSLVSKNYIINFIILLIPISYIIGNLALNLNIFLLILLSFLFFRGDVFHIKYSLTDKLILIFFLYILFNGFFNNLLNFDVHLIRLDCSTSWVENKIIDTVKLFVLIFSPNLH